MSLNAAIVARATTHAGLSALIAGRIYDRRAPQNATRPYVTFEMVGGAGRVRSMSNGVDLFAQRVQFTVIANTVTDELSVHDQLIAAFDWLHGPHGSTAIELAQTDGGRQSLDSIQVLPDARESSQDFIFHYRVA